VNGSDNTTSLWDSTSSISGTDELVVRGATSGADLSVNTKGGELAYPDTDYTTAHYPTSGQPDYSAESGDKYYVRLFDAEASKLTGTFEIKGEFVNSDPIDDLKYDPSDSTYDHHPQGMRVEIGPANVDTQIQDLGRTYQDTSGALVSYSSPDSKTLQIDYQLNAYPVVENSRYPVVFKLTIYDGSPVQGDSDFRIYSIKHIS
jgi:hypothetical protein